MKEKVTIITGSATGVGSATAQEIARQYGRVVINYLSSEEEAKKTAELCGKAGGKVLLVQGDVSSDADCKNIIAKTLDKWGRIDGLVNNAAQTQIVSYNKLAELNSEDFQQIFAVNVLGAYQMIRAVVPQMQKQNSGAIVNVSSTAALNGLGSSIAYAASKGALNTMTLAFAKFLGPKIRVNSICPGFIEGGWWQKAKGNEFYERFKALQKEQNILDQTNKPEEVAKAIVWLLKNECLITGEFIRIDAGRHLI